MDMKIYLFLSYATGDDPIVKECLKNRLEKLYDVKQIHGNVQLIKTDDDISLLKTYLEECFEEEGSYFLVEIADQPNRYLKQIDGYLDRWMNDI
ncbi:hypothetical protein [Jeotgalibacillus campisalis]|uniref:Uncharacterized protein n=1 Tax=Jeotgalibacillus campisalis TaxID=220754 RepID=A0A0C2SB26_9BACL|nr:hypothetical protein [Jeotgalibacillus campisalis]KIL51154.1 hypothetical protein KR50_10350 [Jeotgalibacillus campisalis]